MSGVDRPVVISIAALSARFHSCPTRADLGTKGQMKGMQSRLKPVMSFAARLEVRRPAAAKTMRAPIDVHTTMKQPCQAGMQVEDGCWADQQ